MGFFGNKEEKNILINRIENLRVELRQARESADGHLLLANEMRAKEAANSAPKWEYFLCDNPTGEALNEYGEQGWELVNCVSFTTGFGLGGNEKMTVQFRYIFKRSMLSTYPAQAHEALKTASEWRDRWDQLKQELEIAKEELEALR